MTVTSQNIHKIQFHSKIFFVFFQHFNDVAMRCFPWFMTRNKIQYLSSFSCLWFSEVWIWYTWVSIQKVWDRYMFVCMCVFVRGSLKDFFFFAYLLEYEKTGFVHVCMRWKELHAHQVSSLKSIFMLLNFVLLSTVCHQCQCLFCNYFKVGLILKDFNLAIISQGIYYIILHII